MRRYCGNSWHRKEESMSRVAVITDSNSGITQSQAKELGIQVVPMPFLSMGKPIMKISA